LYLNRYKPFFILTMALRTKKYEPETLPVSTALLFETILNLNEKLEGQSIKIKSVFNLEDKDPSMTIFYSEQEGVYRFKDFSSGRYGDIFDLVYILFKLKSRREAYYKLLDICNDGTIEFQLDRTDVVKVTKKVCKYKLRKWTLIDEKFWTEVGIDINFLREYNIKPLASYTMRITKNSTIEEMTFENVMCYGYFNKEDKLCKIYNPKNEKAKFVKVKDMIQGEEQLKYEAPCLIIASSLKDLGAFKSLKFINFELIAPDSENTKIPKEKLDYYRTKYKYVFTLFDNDVAGMKAMKEYKDLFGIPFIFFNLEKDIAECVKQHGVKNTRVFIKPILLNAIKKNNKTS
jgi:hypothetical protein